MSSIDSDSWQHLARLLDAALDLPPAERARWLDELPEEHAPLKPRLLELLARADETGAKPILETIPKLGFDPTAGGPAEPGAHRPGELVGPYRLIRQIGVGGMG